MTVDTLVRDPQAAHARFEHKPEQPAAEQPAARTCEQCGAGLAAGQDWCLECGTAAPGRLGRRPGMRAATTVVGLTLALVAGAVTAGYAAISGDAGRDVAKPPAASGAPIAQAPPSTPVAPPATAAAAAPATPLPKVAPPKTATPAPAVSHPATPAPPTSTPATPAPSTSAPSTPATTTPSKPSKPAAPAIEPIDLGADAASLYDPYTRSTANSDPADAYDGDSTTAWKVTAVGDGQDMQVGLVVDLSKKRSIKQLKLQTSTPGFRIETYAADTAQLPPDILDTRWAHLHNQSAVPKQAQVALASDSHKYRYVLLWFTTPPKKGPTVKINDIKILG
jgi:hypothetical protein